MLLIICSFTQAQTRIYITPEGSGEKTGTSWSEAASNLTYWLNNAPTGAEIWLKRGTYRPHPSDRTVSFSIKSGVKLYGGFAGTETLLSQRNYTTNVTILSGEIGAAGTHDNSYNVIRVTATTDASTTIIDGVTIANGQATGTSESAGGGAYLDTNSKITFRNCKFSANRAAYSGGALFLKSASVFDNCEFTGNSSYHPTLLNRGTGGAVYVRANGAIFTSCTFTNNWADKRGGGMDLNSASNTSITNCTFHENSLDASYSLAVGGGIMVNESTNTTITNSTFTSNEGGGIYIKDPNIIKLINNTIAYNTNSGLAGVYVIGGTAFPILKNNLIAQNKTNSTQLDYYGNVSSQGGNLIEVTTTPFISSDIKGVQANLKLSSTLSGNKPQTLALQAGSVAIDAGQSGSDVPANGQNGVARENCPDIGAFELTTVAPTLQADLSASNLTTSSITVGFTGGNGTKRIVMMKYYVPGGTTENPVVSNGITYGANSNYQSAPTTTNGFKIVYNGSASSVNVTGLAPSANYRTVIFEYNGCPGQELYLTTVITGLNVGGLQTLEGPKQNQTITFNSPTAKTYGDANFNLTATASSGLTVSYTSSNTSVATVSGSTVTIVGAGSSTITAKQNGNEYYNAATNVERTLTVGQKNLTVNGAAAQNKVYDGNTNAVITGATLVGIVGSDDVSLTNHTAGTFNTKNIGTGKSVSNTMSLTGTKAANYLLTKPTLTANITAKALTITNALVTAKTYDGNTNAAITGATIAGLVQGESVTLNSATAGTFNNKNIGTNKPVSTSMTISGAQSTNYTLTQPTLTGNITAKALTVSNAVAGNKVYNRSTAASITGASLSGVVAGDTVSLGNASTGTFNNYNVGNNKPVTTAMTLSGTHASNYTLSQPAGLTANITPKELTVIDAIASNKVYDATTNATISGATLSGVIKGDVVSLDNSTSGEFDTPTVGSRKPITTIMSLSGTNSGNYTLVQPTLSARITAKALTVTGAVAQNKIYNANTLATIAGATLVGVVSGDDCTLSMGNRGTFSQSTVGINIPVSTSMALTGKKAENYTLTQPSGLTANITPKALDVIAEDLSKTYGTSYVFNGTEYKTSGLVGSDDVSNVSLSSTGAGAGATAGSYPIIISNATGTGLSNYTINYVNGVLTVSERTELTLSGLTVTDKTYNGTTTATISNYGTLQGINPAHSVSLVTTGASASFNNKNHGPGKTVTVTGLTLDGPDAALYFIGNQTTTASILQRMLTLSNFYAEDKIYDGSTAVSDYGFEDDRLSGDAISLYLEIEFENKTAANNKTVNFSNIMITGGTEGNNYYLASTTGTTTANIAKKEIDVINAVAADKVYDGNINTSITGAILSGTVPGDVLALANHTSGSFDSKNVGEFKPVTTIMTITGTDAPNYILVQPSLSAHIIAKELSVLDASASSKIYDGTTNASISGASLMGVEGADEVILSNASSGTFNNKNVENNKPVNTSMEISGDDANNYLLVQPEDLRANIIAKELVVEDALVAEKTYDGNTDASISGAILSGLIKNDIVTLNNATSGTFNNKHAGSRKPVSTSMTISGTDAPNYNLIQPTLTGSINKKELSVTGTATSNKVYDGNNLASLKNAALTGVIPTDDVDLANHTSALFNNKNVGTNKPITTAMSLIGTDKNNYSLVQPTTLTANITPKLMEIMANDITKIQGQEYVFIGTEFATDDLVNDDIITNVDLQSDGTPADAPVGDYTINIENAQGSGLSNYTINYVAGTMYVEQKTELVLSGHSVQNKTYNGTTTATVETYGSLSGITPGDEVELVSTHATATFTDKNADEGKTVTISGLSLTGADADKYYISNQTATANILQKELVFSNFSANNKEYDKSTLVYGGNFTDNRIADDVVVISYNVDFEDYNAGINKNVLFSNISIAGGTDAANYFITHNTGTAKATILTKIIAIQAKNIEKTFGTTYTFDGTEFDSPTLFTGDEVQLATISSTGAIASAAPGDYIIEISNATGLGLSNYTIQYNEGLMTVIEAQNIEPELEVENRDLGNGAQECFNALNNITVAGGSNSVILRSGSTAEFVAGQSIRFLPGFHAQANSNVIARITNTNDFCQMAQGSQLITAPTKEVVFEIVEEEIVPGRKPELAMKVYPNPSNGRFNIEIKNFDGDVKIVIVNITGAIMYSNVSNSSDPVSIDMSTAREGLYFVNIINHEKSVSSKILLKR
jgi:parallel beta-helix repeat protein